MTGLFGACFIPGLCKAEDARLYAARPGCRLWLADINGSVQSTYIFSNPVSPAIKEIPLLFTGKLQLSPTEFQFGSLRWFGEKRLVTWSTSALVVLEPEASSVVAQQSRLSGIVDAAVTPAGEIFLLRRHAESRVVRIAYQPDTTTVSDALHSTGINPSEIKLRDKEEKLEEKDSAGVKGFFLKTFSKPLKTLDNLINDSDKGKEPLTPTPIYHSEPERAPELPPVVRLSSPELDGVRVFSETSNLAFSTTNAEASGGSTPGGKVAGAQANSILSSDQHREGPTAEDHPQPMVHPGNSNVKTQTPFGEADIVFSHRMKKPKKKKRKGAIGTTKKDEDTVSVQSNTSQQSDDSGPMPILSSSPAPAVDEVPENSSPMDALRRADDMLRLVDSVLKGPGDSTSDNNQTTSSQVSNELRVIKEQSFENHAPAFDVNGCPAVLQEGGKDTISNDCEVKQADREAVIKDRIKDEKKNVTDVSNKEAVTGSHSFLKLLNELDFSHVVTAPISSGNIDTNIEINSPGEMSASPSPPSGKTVVQSKEQESKCNDEQSEVYKKSSLGKEDVEQSSSTESDRTEVRLPSYSKSHGKAQGKLTIDASMDIVDSAFATLNSIQTVTDITHEEDPVEKSEEEIHQPEPESEMNFSRFGESGNFMDIYSEVHAIEAENPFGRRAKKDSSSDDFYSKFLDSPPDSFYDDHTVPKSPRREPVTLEVSEDGSTNPFLAQEAEERRLANSWTEFTTPANIYSLSVSNSHVWFTDKSENIYYSTVSGPKGILWRKSSGAANQIAVSPSGLIVWRLHRAVVFAGTKINGRHPEGLKWVEAVRDVGFISVGDNCAWYIKRNGDVMMQRGLYQERPCYKSKRIECEDHRLRQIHCAHGVVWALTEGLRLLVRTGVSDDVPEGTGWALDARESPPYLFSSVSVDNEQVGWAIDVLGQIWFCDGITRNNPLGSGKWFQVPMSEYIVQDDSTLDTIKALASRFDPKKLSYILSTNRGGLITAGVQGVWLALDFRNMLQVCRGSLKGYQWKEGHPSQMSPSSTWQIVSAQSAHMDWGMTWAQHTSKEIYTLWGPGSEAALVPSETLLELCALSVSPLAVWALTPQGEVLVRSGMSPHCPPGHEWLSLDLSQLGDAHLVHLSCNANYVWAVESEGMVYQRIGSQPPSNSSLSPVWLPIETFSGLIFTRVHIGALDWMVWAVDNRRLTFVRVGITDNMPIGQEWMHVPGIQAIDVAVSKTGVWALSPNGEVYFRYAITRERPAGNYWKKIPGTFIKISASAEDDLWAINTEGQLMKCSMRYLLRHQDSSDPLMRQSVSIGSNTSDEVDWEFV